MNDTQPVSPSGAEWARSIRWENGGEVVAGAVCPACGDGQPKPVRLRFAFPWAAHNLQAQVWCPVCGTAFHPAMEQPPYEAVLDTMADCYLEQNAGIDVMAGVLAAVDPKRVKTYLEIGCGFGFLLDYAQAVHGWKAKGFDPGHSARQGKDVLGVDIELAYLDSPEQAGDPADLILCSEVIEHVFEPETLLSVLRRTLAPGGTLLLTTPSAGAIRPQTQPGTLLALLCPGFHVTIYSAKGLETLLRRVGFAEVSVVDLGHTLRAAASTGPLDADFSRPLDRVSYAGYLRTRSATTEPASPIGIGLRYRLLKETVNLGDYAAAKTAADAVIEACRIGWNLDLTDPTALLGHLSSTPLPNGMDAFHRDYPFCLGSILFFLGVLAWQGDRDTERAHQWFTAAALAGERTRAVLHTITADDEETEELVWRARLYAAHVLIWTRAETAVDLLETIADTPSPLLGEMAPHRILVPMRAQIFSDLVNLGLFATADRLVVPVEELLPDDAAERGAAAYALGILNLAHRKAPRTAARWFDVAHRACLASAGRSATAAGLLWTALFHKAQALADAERSDEAAAVLRTLLNHPDAARLPPLNEALKSRAKALAAGTRLRI